MGEKYVVSSLLTIDEDTDINYDVLEFTDEGGFVIQYNQRIQINELITEHANKDAVQFVFTTEVPTKNAVNMEDVDLDKIQVARLQILSLQGDLRIENVGARGSDGGDGGDGSDGGDAPFGSVDGKGGSGGSGGNGGDGSDGGDGPNVVIELPENESLLDIRYRCAKGGKGGQGGRGGKGGKGADGSAAEDGKPGDKGRDGRPGKYGNVFVNGKKRN